MVVVAVAGIAYVNFVKRAVAAVVVILAGGYVASNAEIDVFHNFTLRTIILRSLSPIILLSAFKFIPPIDNRPVFG